MLSDLNYKKVWGLQYRNLAKESFTKFIEYVPFEIIKDNDWNPIIYETIKISKKEFINYEDGYKLKSILNATALIKGNGNWSKGMSIIKNEY